MNSVKNNAVGLLKVTTIPARWSNVRNARYKPLIPINYPIKYRKPRKTVCYTPQKSGDFGLQIDVSPDDCIVACEESKELQDANDLVKKMFSLRFHGKKETTNKKINILTKNVQFHKYDESSPTVKIGKMTIKIGNLREHMKNNIGDKFQKIKLEDMIECRNEHLTFLRDKDYKYYEWTLEKLNLFYRHPLEDPTEQVTKKGTIRALTDKLCQKIVQDKLDAYRAELEKEKKNFYKQNLDKLTYIRENELALGLMPTVTEQKIEEAREMYKKYSADSAEVN